MFEDSNRDLNLYFSQDTMDGFYELLDDLCLLHSKQTGENLFDSFEWSTKVSELEKLIENVSNPYTRQSLTDRYVRLVQRARKTPNHRAHSFEPIQKMVVRLVEQLTDQEAKARDELGLVQMESFRVPDEDETEEMR